MLTLNYSPVYCSSTFFLHEIFIRWEALVDSSNICLTKDIISSIINGPKSKSYYAKFPSVVPRSLMTHYAMRFVNIICLCSALKLWRIPLALLNLAPEQPYTFSSLHPMSWLPNGSDSLLRSDCSRSWRRHNKISIIFVYLQPSFYKSKQLMLTLCEST